MIYFNKTLANSVRPEALQHEQHHYADFRRRTIQLQRVMVDAIRARRDPQMDVWWWFLYD